MTSQHVIALFAVWAVAVASPGPDVAVVLQRSVSDCRRGLAAAAGVVSGITVWIVAAVAGLAAVVAVHPGLMTASQLVGAAVLLWLGLSGILAWRRLRGTRVPGDDDVNDAYASTGPVGSLRRDFLRGLATNLANPKALVFFGSILTPFLRGGVSAIAAVLLVAGMVAVTAAWFGGLAAAASHRRVRERLERWTPVVELGVSVVFVVLGVVFAGFALT